jgi:hypothetical protein
VCSSIEEATALVTEAQANRAVGETRANARSSRSHLVLRIRVETLLFATASLLDTTAQGAQVNTTPASVTFSMVGSILSNLVHKVQHDLQHQQ